MVRLDFGPLLQGLMRRPILKSALGTTVSLTYTLSMINNLVTADGVIVGMCSFFSKIMSNIFLADGLNCWPFV